ncbi:MAG: nucleotidyltransferase domain-containing protein [Bdellovibrio sp.]|nr:MAG: nucleotidyltransferase domain-containing protein [Bdellovibrio sp.]
MRLTPQEVQSILESILNFDKKARVFLYGSRTNDNLKGGDIDLLVVSETLNFSDKISLLALLKEKLGDQKIDLSIKSSEQLKKDPFFQSVLPSAILLNEMSQK